MGQDSYFVGDEVVVSTTDIMGINLLAPGVVARKTGLSSFIPLTPRSVVKYINIKFYYYICNVTIRIFFQKEYVTYLFTSIEVHGW